MKTLLGILISILDWFFNTRTGVFTGLFLSGCFALVSLIKLSVIGLILSAVLLVIFIVADTNFQ